MENNPSPQVESKSFLRSKTTYGLATAAAALIMMLCGGSVTDKEAQTAGTAVVVIAGDLGDGDGKLHPETGPAIVALIGVVIAFYGRQTAKQPLHILPPKGMSESAQKLALLIGISALLLLAGCAGTRVDERGLHMQGNGRKVKYERKPDGTVKFEAEELDHSTATLAGGKSFAGGAEAIGVIAAKGFKP